jgi:hypothetical protein
MALPFFYQSKFRGSLHYPFSLLHYFHDKIITCKYFYFSVTALAAVSQSYLQNADQVRTLSALPVFLRCSYRVY